jgi:hypothetical protein
MEGIGDMDLTKYIPNKDGGSMRDGSHVYAYLRPQLQAAVLVVLFLPCFLPAQLKLEAFAVNTHVFFDVFLH